MIRLSLSNHTGDARLSIRFSIPRAAASDNTAHTILRIIREPTVNAVRHGHATAIRIAGAIEGGRLVFSVGDNGGGFDPENRTGIATGHFGLAGVAERIRAFDGRMSVESQPGKGAHVVISLVLPAHPLEPK